MAQESQSSSAPNHVTWDLGCGACGESLRGQDSQGLCGSCATPVSVSVSMWWMRLQPWSVRERLASGMRMTAVGFALMVVASIATILFAVGSVLTESLSLVAVGFLLWLVPISLITVGTYRMTAANEGGFVHARLRPIGLSLRVLAIAMCTSAVLVVILTFGLVTAVSYSTRESEAEMALIRRNMDASSVLTAPRQNTELYKSEAALKVLQRISPDSEKLSISNTAWPFAAWFGLTSWFVSLTLARVPAPSGVVQGRALAIGLPIVVIATPSVGFFIAAVLLPTYMYRSALLVENAGGVPQ